MVFQKGQQPPKKGESISPEEQSAPEIENVIEKMKEVSQDKKVPETKQDLDFVPMDEDEEIESVRQEVKKTDNNDYLEIPDEVSVDEILQIPADNRTKDQHAELVKHFGVSKYLEILGASKQVNKRIEEISTTYKGVKAIKRTIVQLIIGDQVVRQETEDKPVMANITVD